VVQDRDLQQDALELARGLAQGPTRAYARVKEVLGRTWDLSLEGMLEEERRGIMEVSLTEDFREGLAAFLEKRNPKFQGK